MILLVKRTFVLLISVTYFVESTLDLTVSGQEIQKLLFGSKDDIKIVENGNVSSIFRKNLQSILPPIQPKYSELKLQFASPKRLYYQMHLTSSDTSIMLNPTVTIPYRGRLQKKAIAFKIRFPCTKLKSGIVNLGIVIDFSYDSNNIVPYQRIDLTMKRHCKAANTVELPSPGIRPNNCRKRCDIKNFRRKYCLSDFVARVKISKVTVNNGDLHYNAHIPIKRVYKRPRTVNLTKKNQLIKVRGTALTCDCRPLEAGKRYLLFGREDRFNSMLYVDNYSVAFEIPKNNKNAINLVRDFRREYRTIVCPFSTRYNHML